MKILHESQIDITGFASVRERVLLQSREYFRHEPAPEAFGQFGSLLYLANAWFTPYGSTRLHHHHDEVDIVSVIPRGEILHQGSIGNAMKIAAGFAQIQRSGEQGFSHNEINPTDQPQPFIQLWFQPEKINKQASFELIDINSAGTTPIYRSFDTELSALNLGENKSWQCAQECLIFVYAGAGKITLGEMTQPLERGCLVQIQAGAIQALNELKALVFTRN